VRAAAATVVVLLLGGALLLLCGRGPELPVTGLLRFDSTGRPLVDLTCAECPNGTELRSGSEATAFSNGLATLAIEPPLSLGVTRRTVQMRQPGRGRFDSVDVPLSVDWIPSADLGGLSHPKPKISLVFETRPGVSVIVDGRALARSESGTLRYELDITAEVTGNSPTTQRISKKIPYGIRLPGGQSVRGSFDVGAEVVPLQVDAPGESIVVEEPRFMLAGTTQAEGTVSVEGRAITVDPAGHFAQLMSVSSIGDTTVTVRAAVAGKAPRLVALKVRRVASLAEEATRFARNATASHAAIADGIEQKLGWAVALEGELKQVLSEGHRSSLLLAVDSGCSAQPCLVKLKLGGRCPFVSGDHVTAYGYLSGKWRDPDSGRMIPEVRVEFLRGTS